MNRLKLPRSDRIESENFDSSQPTPKCFARGSESQKVACVIPNQRSFDRLSGNLEKLGLEAWLAPNLDSVFKTISEDFDDWALVIVLLHQKISKESLERHIRLMRMMDVRLPILVLADYAEFRERRTKKMIYSDFVAEEPETADALAVSIGVAVEANKIWQSRFDDYRLEAMNRISRTFK